MCWAVPVVVGNEMLQWFEPSTPCYGHTCKECVKVAHGACDFICKDDKPHYT